MRDSVIYFRPRVLLFFDDDLDLDLPPMDEYFPYPDNLADPPRLRLNDLDLDLLDLDFDFFLPYPDNLADPPNETLLPLRTDLDLDLDLDFLLIGLVPSPEISFPILLPTALAGPSINDSPAFMAIGERAFRISMDKDPPSILMCDGSILLRVAAVDMV